MAESIREWPPRKKQGEPEDIWLSRLDQDTHAEYQDWLTKLKAGETEPLLEAVQSVIEDEEYIYFAEKAEKEPIVINELSDEEAAAEVVRLYAGLDQDMAAVRNGDPEAVREYAEFNLFTLKYEKLHE